MEGRSGFEAAPVFEPLLQPLTRIEKLLAEHLPAARTTEGDTAAAPAAASEAAQPALGGAINSRQDAVRAIDAANAFFRRHEPSSPVPLLLDRAKRLVAKSFLEVLEDIAPDTLGEVRKLSGVRNEGNQ
jgi:type VI secretion system protein ImpA